MKIRNKWCQNCGVSVKGETVFCHFCQDAKPSPIDQSYLHDVLLHLTSHKSSTDASWRERLGLILENAGISEAEIEKTTPKNDVTGNGPTTAELPKSGWLIRTVQDGHGDGLEDYHALYDMVSLGKTLRAENRFKEAELVLNHAMSLARHFKTLGSVPGIEAMLTGLIRNCTAHLSDLYEETERYSEAEEFHIDFANETDFSCIPELNKAFEAIAESIDPDSLIRRANLSFKQRRWDEAESLYLKALVNLERLESEKPPVIDHQECNEIVSQLKSILGEFSSSNQSTGSEETNSVLSEYDRYYSPEKRRQLTALSGLADVYIAKGNLDRAKEVLEAAQQLIQPLSNEKWTCDKVEVWSRQADLESRQNNYQQAEQLLTLCINSLETLSDKQPNGLSTLLDELKERHSDCLSVLH